MQENKKKGFGKTAGNPNGVEKSFEIDEEEQEELEMLRMKHRQMALLYQEEHLNRDHSFDFK
jgi:hypothetical protein